MTVSSHNPQSQVIHLPVTPLASRVFVLVLALILTQVLLKFLPEPLYILEERLGTLSWQLTPDTRTEERLAILAIDEASLQQYGPWPWPRSLLARLSDRLAEQGARLQIFDMVLPEAKTGDDQLEQSLRTNRALLGQIPLKPQQARSANAVTGQPVLPQTATDCGPVPRATGFIANHKSFSQIPAGHIAAHADSDGSIRHQPLGYCFQGHFYPALALTAYQALFATGPLQWSAGNTPGTDKAENTLGWVENTQGWAKSPAYRLVAADYPLLNIPTDSRGRVRINYRQSPNSFLTYSAADLLNNSLPPGRLQNRLVLVGATAFGLGDIVPTPHSGTTPGVELQARLFTGLLDNRIPYTPAGQWFYMLGVQLLSGLLLLALAHRAGHAENRLARLTLLAAPLLLPLIFIGTHNIVLQHQSLWLGWLAPSLFALLAAPTLSALEYLRSRHERQRLYDNLSRYLPKGFARQTALQQPKDQIEVEQKQVIVFSADLRNFSACQQHLSAEASARLLHRFFTCSGQLISQNGGTLYELHADSLLAIWPLNEAETCDQTPHKTGNPYRQSVQTAQSLYQQLQPLLQQELPESLAPLDLAIGLAAGSVTAGSLGCGGLRTHMLMGETVTLALRLQQMSQELASPILIDTRIARALPPEETCSQGRYLLDGLTRPREIYSLLFQAEKKPTNGRAETAEQAPIGNSRVVPLRRTP